LRATIPHNKLTHAHWQFESPRPRAARIQVKHSIAHLLFGNVTVAADHNRESSRFGLEVQLLQIMQHIDGNTAQLNHLSFRQLATPGRFIDVSTHGGDGTNRGKLLEDIGRADIPGMNDVLGPAQRFDCLRAQQAMRVGDDADENGSSQFSEAVS
jgi:hypothetical protein